MKKNYQSLLDANSYSNHEVANTTASKKKEEKIERPLPKLPKRKFQMDKHQSFYLFHIPVMLLMLVAGIFLDSSFLIPSILPYAVMVFLSYRMGGSLKGKGLDYVLWNLSVLLSTYTNTQTPNLRRFGRLLRTTGLIVLVLLSAFSAWLMLVGLLLVTLGLIFAFAEKEEEAIVQTSRFAAIGMLLIGAVSVFSSPDMTLALVIVSLAFHHLYELWDEYEFTLE